jgi:hypothetical protein
MDSSGVPWAVWNRNTYDSSLAFSKWLGNHWADAKSVSPNAPGVWDRFCPSIAFDHSDRDWLAWNNAYDNNDSKIASSFWTGTGWSPEVQVSRPDSSLYFAPYIACGGERVWCVWYGGQTDTSPYSVYASRWDDASGAWQPQVQVSPPDGNLHWFCSVAVDSLGLPHVVWCEVPHSLLYYSFYNGNAWVGPFVVNDTSQVKAAYWADPHIAIDCDGDLQVSYVGVATGATERDVFYTRHDKQGWSSAIRVNAYGQYTVWTADIAAERPGNVWVTWDGQGSWPDQFRIHASHWDGTGWSPETRLDNDSAHDDGAPRVALDATGCPWVAWAGVDYQTGAYVAFYNRYGVTGIKETSLRCGHAASVSANGTSPSLRGFNIGYRIPSSTRARLEIFAETGKRVRTVLDEHEPAGEHSARWDGYEDGGRRAPAGTYFCCLRAGKQEATCKLVLLAR